MVNMLQPDCLISKLNYDTPYKGDFEKAMSPLWSCVLILKWCNNLASLWDYHVNYMIYSTWGIYNIARHM